MTDTTAEREQLHDFSTFSEPIVRALGELGWSSPMPVQAQVVPVMRRGRDCIVQAAATESDPRASSSTARQ